MSNSETIIASQTKTSSWRKSDTTWTLGLFGTAIGAGVLFFPIRAGFGGLIPILLMLLLAYPIAFYCHRALARLCLSGSNPSGNITETVEEHFGKTGGADVPCCPRRVEQRFRCRGRRPRCFSEDCKKSNAENWQHPGGGGCKKLSVEGN